MLLFALVSGRPTAKFNGPPLVNGRQSPTAPLEEVLRAFRSNQAPWMAVSMCS